MSRPYLYLLMGFLSHPESATNAAAQRDLASAYPSGRSFSYFFSIFNQSWAVHKPWSIHSVFQETEILSKYFSSA